MQVTTMKIPYQATSSAPKGDRPILDQVEQPRLARPKGCYVTSGALTSSQDALRADSDLWPAGHAIGGTAQLALRSSSAAAIPGRVTLSEYYGPGVAAGGWTSPPPQLAIA